MSSRYESKANRGSRDNDFKKTKEEMIKMLIVFYNIVFVLH